MTTLRAVTNVASIVAVGLLALYLFFLLIGAIAVDDPLWMTIGAAIAAVFVVVHSVRMRRQLADHQHEDLARAVHALRERRGF